MCFESVREGRGRSNVRRAGKRNKDRGLRTDDSVPARRCVRPGLNWRSIILIRGRNHAT